MRKMIRQRILSFDVRSEAQSDFDAHTQSRMKDMVWTGTCRSWCKFPTMYIILEEFVDRKITVKRGTNGKVTALWPGSSLHYIQVLAENRWEDYHWAYEGERYAYWGHGISWVESPELDPLGLEEQESLKHSTTIPGKDSDLSFYLWKSPPLPQNFVAFGETNESRFESNTEPGLSKANGVVNGIENGVKKLAVNRVENRVENGVRSGFVNGTVNGVSGATLSEKCNGHAAVVVVPV